MLCIRARLLVGPLRPNKDLGFSPCGAEQLMEKNDYIDRLLNEVHAEFGSNPLPADLIVRFSLAPGLLGRDLKYEQLYMYPALQESLAFIAHYTPSKWLLEQEAPAIRDLRRLHHPNDVIP